MIDLKVLRDNPDVVRNSQKLRGEDVAVVDQLIAADSAARTALTEFAKHQVNLTFIQSRPTGRQLGHYHFIIDVEGHIADPKVEAAIAGVKSVCDEIRFLGSYPRVGRIHA